MVGKIFIGKVKGERVVFSTNEFGEKTIAGTQGTVDVELFFDPRDCKTYAYVGGEVVASAECSVEEIVIPLLHNGIKISMTGIKLPKVKEIWIPREVDKVLNDLKRLSRIGSEIKVEQDSISKTVIIRSVRAYDEDEFDEYLVEISEGNDFAYVREASYFVVDRNGYTSIIMMWRNEIVDIFGEKRWWEFDGHKA